MHTLYSDGLAHLSIFQRRQTEEENLLSVFNEYDANRDGFIEIEEFRRILNMLGEQPSEEILLLEFAAVDDNDDGKVDFEEFREWWLDYK